MLSDHIPYIGILKDVVHSKYNGKILYLMISGSDLFGFRSPDSDTDYRGCFQVKTNVLLGVKTPRSVIELKKLKDGMTHDDTDKHDVYESDTVLDELGKEVNLLLDGNCNHYEHLFAEPLVTSPEHLELQVLFHEHMNLLGIYRSYRGMADQNYKKFILGGKHTVKKYLYVLRGLMAGEHVLRSGEIQPNINILAEKTDGTEVIKELIDLKQRGMEKDPVNKNLDKYNEEVQKWFKRIDLAAKETLGFNAEDKEEAKAATFDGFEAIEAANKWLRKTRIKYLDQ